jgi:hypothetical protein
MERVVEFCRQQFTESRPPLPAMTGTWDRDTYNGAAATPPTGDPQQAAAEAVRVPESTQQAGNANLFAHFSRHSRLRKRVRSGVRRARGLPAVRRLRCTHHEVPSEEDSALQQASEIPG